MSFGLRVLDYKSTKKRKEGILDPSDVVTMSFVIYLDRLALKNNCEKPLYIGQPSLEELREMYEV